ncbi:hexosyltransferase GAUT11-like [Bidens hawaiensis]|uniref:hexosyltransferase GAUT11-like n=1 Tax=Bidens hawaiensis TaxID=980011 RepID=UPI00404B036F
MRRRAARVRWRLSIWIWLFLGFFSLAAGFLIIIILHHQTQTQDRLQHHQLLDRNARNIQVTHKLNLTKELNNGNSYARQLLEQMSLAKAYLVLAKEHNNLHLAWQLTSKIRNCQSLLSKAAMRADPITQQEAKPLIISLSSLILKSQDAHYDLATTMMTMKSHIQALEERANAATVQTAFFGSLAAESLPKNLCCVNVKLVADWIKNETIKELADENNNSPRLLDNNVYHFCLFSDNLVAVSAVVNSTVSNADHPKQLVFHIVTNRAHYAAMQAWFVTNDFKGSMIEIQKVEDLTWLNASYSPVVRFFGSPRIQMYESLLNHLRFYIPEIYPHLEKIIFLDDDVIVQKDLTPLFSLDLHGNVNGAVETCLEAHRRLYKYLNFSNPVLSSKIDPQGCGWAFGLNVFDLVAWRNASVTSVYHYWEEQNADGNLWKLGTLPAGLLTFYGRTEPLDRRWHVLGLGFDVSIDRRLIESAAVVHFNGNMKPWLKIGIERYRALWERYVDKSHPYAVECATS